MFSCQKEVLMSSCQKKVLMFSCQKKVLMFSCQKEVLMSKTEKILAKLLYILAVEQAVAVHVGNPCFCLRMLTSVSTEYAADHTI